MSARTWSRWGLVLGLLLAGTAQAATVVKYVHTDALGSVVAVTDAARTVIERRKYEPYGQQLPGVQAGPGYTGHVQDAATGLVYMQQRYYDPFLGRFLSIDPVQANPNTGAGFNRYTYTANNPYRFTDPDGRQERQFECAGTRIGHCGSNSASVQSIGRPSERGSGSASGGRSSAKIKYNAPPPRTVPPSGENLQALECTANCVGADEILVTGGAEQSGHSRNSLHYEDKAVDIVGPPFNDVEHRDIIPCARACGYTHGGWEVNRRFYPDGDARSSIYRDHWHFQIGASGRVPPLPGIGVEVSDDVTRSPTMRGGMIGP